MKIIKGKTDGFNYTKMEASIGAFCCSKNIMNKIERQTEKDYDNNWQNVRELTYMEMPPPYQQSRLRLEALTHPFAKEEI